MLFAAVFVLCDSEYGRNFLAEQTESAVESLLGQDYVAEVGRQSFGLDEAGHLAILWNDVEIGRAGMSRPEARFRTIAVGLEPFALATGRLAARSIEVAGAEIDLTATPAAAEVATAARGLAPMNGSDTALPPVQPHPAGAFLPALTSRLMVGAERQIGTLHRRGMDRVTLTDIRIIAPIAPGGEPFVSRIDTAVIDLSNPGAMRLSGMIEVDKIRIPIGANIRYDVIDKRIAEARCRIGPLPLGKLLPPGSPNDPRDARPFATDADASLSLSVEPRLGETSRLIRLNAELGPGKVQAGRGHTVVRSAALAFDYVEGEDRVTIGPNRVAFDGFDMTLAGALAPVYDKPGVATFNGFAVSLESTDMRSTIGSEGGASRKGRVVLEARTDLASQEIRLQNLGLTADGGSLSGTAVYRYGASDAKTEVNIALKNLSASVTKAFWPFNIAVNPRRWVESHVRDGAGSVDGSIVLALRRDRLGPAFRPGGAAEPGEVEIEVAFDGVSAKTMGELPDVGAATGAIETHGSDTLITVNSAAFDGISDVALEGGLVSFSRVPDAATPASLVKIVGNLNGSLPRLLALAAHRPVDALRALPIRAEDASGTAKTVATVDLLLGDDVPQDRELQGWNVAIDLKDAGLAGLPGGRRLSGGTGRLEIDRSAARGRIEASLDGAKGRLSFDRAFGERPANGRRMELAIDMAGSEAAKLVPALDEVLAGPVTTKIVEDDRQRFAVEIDLSPSTLTLPWIGWRKGAGVVAKLGFTVQSVEDRFDIGDVALRGDGFSANGRIETDTIGLRSAAFTDVALNPGDAVQMRLDRVQNGYSLDIKGKRFDARPMLNDVRSNIGAKTAAPPKRGTQQLDISAAVDEVVGFGGETLNDFALDYAGSGSTVAALSITGKAKRRSPFSLDVSPRGKDRSVALRAENAGALMDFTGSYGRMEGGRLSLDLLGSYDDGYRGKLEAKDFTLVDEPRLSRLVAAAPSPNSKSLSQVVGRDLRAERASFDHASAGIDFGKDGLKIKDGIIRGPIFGSSFSGRLYDAKNNIDIVGSFMPAYGLNRIFGAIPVFGQILGNGREGGLVGITYRLSGKFGSPRLEVNPLSAIAPGIFRNIFAYQ